MTARADQTLWSAAMNAALLGTDRAPFAPQATDDALGAACAAITANEADEPTRLLRTAGAIATYRRCGWVPAQSSEPTPPVSPPHDRRLCSPAAAGLLHRMLNGEHESLLRLWIELAARAGVRPPADTLRELLDIGARNYEIGRQIGAVGGARARWLSHFNENWSYAADRDVSSEDLMAAWETGLPGDRMRAFELLRLRDPDHARTLLEASWSTHSVPDRILFLVTLGNGLSAADDRLLERALDDKRQEVRERAAELLTRIPESSLVRRMAERARSAITLGAVAHGAPPRIEVTLPGDDMRPALARDGIKLKPPPSTGMGERAWWLAQIVALVPPSTWSSSWSLEPSAILDLVRDHEWRDLLVGGWRDATHRYRDEAWALAFWDHEATRQIGGPWGVQWPERLFVSVVSPARVDEELRTLIAAGHETLRQGRVLEALREWSHEWSDALARAVALKLKQYAGADKVALAGDFGLRMLIERAGSAVPISAIDAFTGGWPDHAEIPTWTSDIDQLTSVLTFRRDLHLAFSEEPAP